MGPPQAQPFTSTELYQSNLSLVNSTPVAKQAPSFNFGNSKMKEEEMEKNKVHPMNELMCEKDYEAYEQGLKDKDEQEDDEKNYEKEETTKAKVNEKDCDDNKQEKSKQIEEQEINAKGDCAEMEEVHNTMAALVESESLLVPCGNMTNEERVERYALQNMDVSWPPSNMQKN